MKRLASLVLFFCLLGCSAFEDAATSLAYDIEKAVSHLGPSEGATFTITHDAKSRASKKAKLLTVQFDKVGALIVWYKDSAGNVLESGSTSYHARFVDTPETIIVEKSIDSSLKVEVERRGGRAVVTKVF